MSDSAQDGVEIAADRFMKAEGQDIEARIRAIQGSVLSADSELRDELAALTRRLADLEYIVRCRRPRTGSGERRSGTIVLIAAFTLCAYLVYTVALPKVHDLGVSSMILDAARTIRDTLS